MAIASWTEIRALLSPQGQQQLLDFVRRAKEERGQGWLESIKIEYPTFCWIADLISNRTADDAFAELQKQFPMFPLSVVKTQIYDLHKTMQTEIEKPRG